METPASLSSLAEKFRNEKRWLILNRNFVLTSVKKATDKREKVNDAVLEWINDVKKLIQEVNLQMEKAAGDTSVINSEWYLEMIEEMMALNAQRKFEPFSIPNIIGLDQSNISSTKEDSDQLLKSLEDDRFCFNSTTLKELSKELQDHSKHRIGLYGKRGSGKTTLVKKLGEKAKHLNIFDAVLFTNVSQNPDIRKIQGQIARSLNLNLDNESNFGRALKIKSKLDGMNRILVILDDIAAKFDPENIGIPCNGQQCKFLLTTRHKQDCTLRIYESVMPCETTILMRRLPEESAWRLFKEHSGIDDDESSPDLLNVAKEVAFECNALPGTIEDVGFSLRNKPIEEYPEKMDRWKLALSQVASLTGDVYKDGMYQHDFIQKIVDHAIKDKNYLYIQSKDMD
ncbi:P-loop containing nucleoside triphosphate hydrolase [Sesbania bispinosa]|nr:P-loop containing nucleoside triphosphate hydrolase [Sesbania bispinosa]